MIYYVRHGESIANKEGYFAGNIDSPLTNLGRNQAMQIGWELVNKEIWLSHIVSSNQKRSIESSNIIAEVVGYNKEIKVEPNFNEYDFGVLTGKQKKEIDSEMFMAVQVREDPYKFYNRIRNGWNECIQLSGNSLIVSSSFVRLMIECVLRDDDIKRFHDDATINDPSKIICYENKFI